MAGIEVNNPAPIAGYPMQNGESVDEYLTRIRKIQAQGLAQSEAKWATDPLKLAPQLVETTEWNPIPGLSTHSGPIAIKPCEAQVALEEKLATKCDYAALKITVGKRSSLFERADKSIDFKIVCGRDQTPAIVDCSFVDLIGPPVPGSNCTHGQGKEGRVFDVGFFKSIRERAVDHLSFNAQSIFNDSDSWADILPQLDCVLWPPAAKPNVYWINANTCGQKRSIRLSAYPDLSTTLSIAPKEKSLVFTLLGSEEKKVKSKEKLKNILSGNIAQYYEATLESKYDNKTYLKISLSNGDDQSKFAGLTAIRKLYNILSKFEGFKDIVDDVLSKGNGELTMEVSPSISLDCKNEEVMDKRMIDYNCGITLQFNPLLRLTASYDFAGPLLRLIPGVGPALSAIKWLVEECKAGKLALKIIIDGSLSLSGSIRRSQQKWEGSIDPKGLVEFKLQFEAAYNIDVCYGVGDYKKSGSFQATGKAGIKAEPTKDAQKKYYADSNGFFVYMDVRFTGLWLYFLTASSTGTINSVPGAPGYVAETQQTDKISDSDMDNIPNDQKKKVWDSYPIMSQYYQLF